MLCALSLVKIEWLAVRLTMQTIAIDRLTRCAYWIKRAKETSRARRKRVEGISRGVEEGLLSAAIIRSRILLKWWRRSNIKKFEYINCGENQIENVTLDFILISNHDNDASPRCRLHCVCSQSSRSNSHVSHNEHERETLWNWATCVRRFISLPSWSDRELQCWSLVEDGWNRIFSFRRLSTGRNIFIRCLSIRTHSKEESYCIRFGNRMWTIFWSGRQMNSSAVLFPSVN